MVMRPLMPSICMAPSPTKAIATRSGKQNLAAVAEGTPQHIVASVPESDAVILRRT